MKTVLIIILTIIAVNAIIAAVFFYLKSKRLQASEQPSEPVSNQEPTTESEQPQEPVSEPEKPTDEEYFESIVGKHKFKIGYWIVDNEDDRVLQIVSMDDVGYQTQEGAFISYKEEKYFHHWTIKDAKDGDLLALSYDNRNYIFILKDLYLLGFEKMISVHCFYCKEDGVFYEETDSFHVMNRGEEITPATKEQRDLLFSKMAEVGYTWDAETKTLSKKEEAQEPETLMEEPKEEDPQPTLFGDLIDYFGKIVTIPRDGKTYSYLKNMYEKFINDGLLDEGNFPTPYNYWGEKENDCWIEQGNAKLLANILSELVPDKAELLQQMGYDFPIKGAYQPTYGWYFLTDPNVNRDTADIFYSANKDIDLLPELREELGSKMISYNNDVSELYIDLTKFMPTAPPPFLDAYKNRPNGTPVNCNETRVVDMIINAHVSEDYNLDTKDAEKRQRTIQAIADKEYKKPHLFGNPRTVTEPKYGTMTFYPVFGEHNIGVYIDPDGKIADLCYTIGKIDSDSCRAFSDKEYGRRRPGQGDYDPSANIVKIERALCNYTIEENDGHSTGYYQKDGKYVNVDTGQIVGDYNTYCQGLLYANSYPSRHSLFIKGVAMTLAEIMPDRANKILRAAVEFSNSRIICRYHNQSDVIHGRVIGGFLVPKLCACTNINYYNRLKEAQNEYEQIQKSL